MGPMQVLLAIDLGVAKVARRLLLLQTCNAVSRPGISTEVASQLVN